EETMALLGPQELVALVEADNTRPEVSLRATPGRTTRDQLLAELATAGVAARPSPLSPDCLLMERGDPGQLAAVREGRAVVQDAASARGAPAVRARPRGGAGPGGRGGRPAPRPRGQGRPPGRPRRPGPGRRGQPAPGPPGRPGGGADRGGRPAAAGGGGWGRAGRPPRRTGPGRAAAAVADAPSTTLGSLPGRPEARWRHGPQDIAG